MRLTELLRRVILGFMSVTKLHPLPESPARNEGVAFDPGWIEDVRINLSASERRVQSLPGRRSVKKDAQAAWLLKAVTSIDLANQLHMVRANSGNRPI